MTTTTLPAAVRIVEMGPRDGLQNEKAIVPAATKIALIAIGTAFPLYLNVYAGIRNVDQTLIEAARNAQHAAAAVAVPA